MATILHYYGQKIAFRRYDPVTNDCIMTEGEEEKYMPIAQTALRKFPVYNISYVLLYVVHNFLLSLSRIITCVLFDK